MRTTAIVAMILAVGCGGSSDVVPAVMLTVDAAVALDAPVESATTAAEASSVMEAAMPEAATPEASTPDVSEGSVEATTVDAADEVTTMADAPVEAASLPCCSAAELHVVVHPGCIVCAVDSGNEAAATCCYGTPLACGLPCRDH